MNKNYLNNKGFSLVELMVALPIFIVVMATVVGVYVTMEKLFPGGITQVSLQSYGRSGLEKISDDVRSAISSTINGSGDTISLTLDPNNTYNNSADDITAQYSVVGSDLIYDPDTFIAGNERTFLENIQAETGIPYFQSAGNVIVVTFKVIRSNVTLGTQSCSMTTSVKMRNGDE